MSKMQDILDKALDANKAGDNAAAIAALIEAVKLLSRGERQIMGDLERLQACRTDQRIGSADPAF